MRLRNSVFILSSFLLLMTASLVFAPTSAAIGSIGGRPALPRENEPRSQSIFIHTIKKGQTIDDKVLVSNRSAQTQTVVLGAVDAIPSNTGSFTCKQNSADTTDAGGWIALKKHEVKLKPGEVDIVSFTITAPKDADVGEHNACLTFQAKEDDGEISGSLRIRTRSAVRVALTIPGKLHRDVSISTYEVSQQDYTQTYTVSVHNKGNVSSDTRVGVALRTLLGGTVYENGGEYSILANKTLVLPYLNKQSPFFGGWYFAEASASYDKNAAMWGTQRSENLKTVYADSKLIFIWPKPLAMLIIIFILAAIAWVIAWLISQEKQRQEILELWKPHKVKKGDSIQALADESDVSWKKLARINRLKAPYVLTVGETIHVPKVAKPNHAPKHRQAKAKKKG